MRKFDEFLATHNWPCDQHSSAEFCWLRQPVRLSLSHGAWLPVDSDTWSFCFRPLIDINILISEFGLHPEDLSTACYAINSDRQLLQTKWVSEYWVDS